MGVNLASIAKAPERHSAVSDLLSQTPIARIDYRAYVFGSLKMSADCKHVVYLVDNEGTMSVGLDNAVGKAYHGIAKHLAISADGTQTAYTVTAGDKDCFVVVGGQESRHYDAITARTPILSPNGKRVAFGAHTAGKGFVIVDGIQQEAFDGVMADSLTFSSDSNHLGYAAHANGTWCAVLDGKVGVGFEGIGKGSLVFSPNGQRSAYVAYKRGKFFTVVDSIPQPGYMAVGFGAPKFSPNGQHVAYFASDDGVAWFLLLDGNRKMSYEEVGHDSLAFSPDSERIAYAARRGSKWFVVVDGREGKHYDGIGTIVFSPDSNRIAIAVKLGRRWLVVEDSLEGKAYNDIALNSLTFTPCGRAVAYAARHYNCLGLIRHTFVVINAKEGNKNRFPRRFEHMLSSGTAPFRFDCENSVHYLITRLIPAKSSIEVSIAAERI